MSSASIPIPRQYTTGPRPTGSRYSMFWPVLIFLCGAGSLTLYQVISMEDQLDEVTQNIDHLDTKVQKAQYEKAKFYAIARDILRLSPKDPIAKEVAVYFKLEQLREAQPELLALDAAPDPILAAAMPATPPGVANATNAAPVSPLTLTPATNSAPVTLPAAH